MDARLMPYSMAAGPAKKNTMAPTTHAVHPKQVKDDVMIFFPVSFRHSKVKKRQQMQGRNNNTNVATRRLVLLVNVNELAKGAIRMLCIRVVSR